MNSRNESEVSLNFQETENPEQNVSLCSLCLTIFGLLFYLLDIVTDISLAIWYLKHGHYLFFALTLVPIYTATIIDLAASWFRNELRNKGTRFWIQCIALSLVHLWGFKIICSLIQAEYKAYKTQQVNADMREKIRKKTIRVCWLKFNEGTYEAFPQILLQPSILSNVTEIPTYELPFVTACGELEAIINSFDLPLTVLMSFVMSLCAAVAAMANLDRAYSLTNGEEVSTAGVFMQYAWLILTAVSRILSIRMILLLYPMYTLLIICLHIVAGSLYWYYNFSIEDQSDIERKTKSILTGVRLFLSPYYLVRWKELLFTLHVIHFIGNSAATAVWASSVTSPYTVSILNCFLFVVGTACCGYIYWRSRRILIPRNSFFMR